MKSMIQKRDVELEAVQVVASLDSTGNPASATPAGNWIYKREVYRCICK